MATALASAPSRAARGPAIRRRLRDADALPLAGFLAATAAAALIGTVTHESPRRAVPWYLGLRKARGNPPAVVFPVVWTALYAATATSAWRVWRRPPSEARTRALALWCAQLVLNAAWTPLFFGARRPRVALADLAALWATLAAYAEASRRVDRPAAWLTAPYLAWVTYAGYLNAEIVRRNPPAWRRALGGH